MSDRLPEYSLRHRISHADVDLLGEIKVSALLGLLEQAAVEASSEAGFDPSWYASAGKVWLIRRTQLERAIPVGGGDTLEVATHVTDFRRARSLRSYEVRRLIEGRPDGPEDVARARTDWVYCDTQSGKPASVPDQMRLVLSGADAGSPLPRKRLSLSDPGGEVATLGVEVRPSNLDHLVHVNNAVYANFLEDGAFALFARLGFGLDRMLAAGGALRVRSIDLEYLEDASFGSRLEVRSWIAAGTDWSVQPRHAHLDQTIEREEGGTLLRAHSEWVWRRTPSVLGGHPEL